MGVTDLLLLSCLGFAITAHAQDCAVPAGGPNMHLKDEYILKETFSDGDQAAFECAVGYVSEGGSSSITCTAGTWSAVKLKCERRNCGSPGELLNGQIHYPAENLFGDHIEITCDEGYRLVGKSTITCGAQGWMGRLPRCEVATCDEAPQVKDATITPYKDPYNFGDVVQYSCQNGLILNGSASISCSDDGTFKPDPPTCTRVQCEDLDLPNLDWVSGSRPPHKYKATITYKCRTGYKMVGPATLTCDINSQWSPGLPRCDMVTCNPPHLVNGSFNPVKEVYKYGDVVQYSCKTNLRLSGLTTALCSADGTFKPAPPTCIMICNPPPVGTKTIVSPVKQMYEYKDVVHYSCQHGFKLNGSNSASCSDDGTFKPHPPTCTMMTCNPPPPLEHGSFSPARDSYKYQDVVEFSCQTGFKLSGSNSASCSDDGTFKPHPPTCTKVPAVGEDKPGIYCEKPHVNNGHLTHDARPPYRPNDEVTFECKSGYKMDGESTLTCQADHQWSPPPPKCKLSDGAVAGAAIGGVGLAGAGVAAGRAYYKKKKNRRRRKNNNGNCTNDKGGKPVGDVVGLMETPTDNGHVPSGTEDKSPVGNANV